MPLEAYCTGGRGSQPQATVGAETNAATAATLQPRSPTNGDGARGVLCSQR
jgi:hypothetical protein